VDGRRLEPLGVRPFARLLLSYTVNELGDAVGMVALALLVFDRTHEVAPTAGFFLIAKFLPAFFATGLRDALHAEAFAALRHRPELTMLGRTYASGFEADLEDWLLARPRRTVLDPACRWGIWYPLRRAGAFARLTPQEQGAILKEHGTLGRAYGEAGLAHDVRLACHGLDTHDNDFVIGLIGRELHPLSHLVQAMRRTAQTSQYLASLGPFFVGHVLWQSPSR